MTTEAQISPADHTPAPPANYRSDLLSDGHGFHLRIIVVLSLMLKLGLLLSVRGAPTVLDETDYLSTAQVLAAEGRYDTTFRPPLYPVCMAALLKLGGGLGLVRLGQILLSTASVLLAWRIARRLFDQRAAAIAAAVVAFDPVLVMFTLHIWSETLFVFLLMAALDLLTLDNSLRRWWPCLAAGLLLGIAGLTRPVILTFVPLLLPWMIWQLRRATPPGPSAKAAKQARPQNRAWPEASLHGGLRFLVLAAACALAILPWTLRNARVTGAFILVDTNGPFNFLVGSQPDAAFVDKDDFWSACYGRVAGTSYHELMQLDAAGAQKLALESALAHIREAPARFLKKSLWEAGHLWTLDSFLLRHLRNGWYGPAVGSGVIALLTVVSMAVFIVLVLAAMAGLAIQPPSSYRGLAILLAIHATLLFGLTYSLSRYCLPLHAVLAIPAAGALAHLRGNAAFLLRNLWGRCRTAILVLVILALGLAWSRDLPLIADMITNGGAQHTFVAQADCPPAS